jgi:hypothetical protein
MSAAFHALLSGDLARLLLLAPGSERPHANALASDVGPTRFRPAESTPQLAFAPRRRTQYVDAFRTPGQYRSHMLAVNLRSSIAKHIGLRGAPKPLAGPSGADTVTGDPPLLEPDGTGVAALVALTAFNGAAVALLASLTAVLEGDAGLAIAACSGGMLCACAWWLNLRDEIAS